MIPVDFAIAETRETPVVRAVRRIGPAVVNIGSEHVVRSRSNPFSTFGKNPFFDEFFRDFFDYGFDRPSKRTSLGSGVIIDGKQGFILTNAHVLSQTGTITVTLQDEREFGARIVGADPDSDIAVLRIVSDQSLPAAKMGTSADLMIGETVIAIGNPFGFSHTVTTGVISAVNRSIREGDRVYQNFIQIDASINPGNSGGPLLNINGDVIGINTAIYANAQGIGFAIPIDTAKKIVSDLIKYGEVVPAWIGVTVQAVDPSMAQYLKVPDGRGIMIRDVDPSGPGAGAGLKNGDIIRLVGRTSVPSVEAYRSVMRQYAEGDLLTVDIWRDGGVITLKMEAGVFPAHLAPELAERLLGIRVENAVRSRGMSAGKGVVIADIHPRSHLARIGADTGDVIRQVDEMTVETVDDFYKAMVKYRDKKSVVILLFRADQGYNITVKLSD